MDQILLLLPKLLGLDPATFTLCIAHIGGVCRQYLSKLIPESTTGWLGVVRRVAAFIGLALANRITPNVSSKDIAKAVAAGIPDSAVKEAAGQLQAAVNTGLGSAALAEAIVDVGAPPTAGRSTFENRMVEGGE
jgi:hypothetical protein